MINELSPEELNNVQNPASAGILVITKDGQVLLTKRSEHAKVLPNTWSVPSGVSRVNELESLESCAKRKMMEEMGHLIPETVRLPLIERYYFNNGIYFLFAYIVPKKIFVTIDIQHNDVGWFQKDNLPEPISPQVLDAISRI